MDAENAVEIIINPPLKMGVTYSGFPRGYNAEQTTPVHENIPDSPNNLTYIHVAFFLYGIFHGIPALIVGSKYEDIFMIIYGALMIATSFSAKNIKIPVVNYIILNGSLNLIYLIGEFKKNLYIMYITYHYFLMFQYSFIVLGILIYWIVIS